MTSTTSTATRALLALTAVGALLLTGCGADTDPGAGTAPRVADVAATTTPSPSAASTPVSPVAPAATTQVPGDFPLAAGLPRTNGDDGSPVATTDRPTWTDVELCGEVAWSQQVPAATTDLAGASYTGEAEDTRSRLLALYADDLGAQQALDTLRDAYTACPDGEVGGTEQVYEVVETSEGAATITHRYRTDGRFDTGLEVIELVAVGNALYLSSYYGEGGGSDETIASSIDFAHQSSRPVWKAMGAFSDTGVAPAAEFPLAAGWPEEPTEPGRDAGLFFPVDQLTTSFPDYACDHPAPAADTTETLRAEFRDVEAQLSRELLTFADADAAVAYLAELRSFYDDCPTLSGDPGLTYPVRTFDTATGGASFAVVRTTEYDGEPAIGFSALHAVRVGRAILLDSSTGEGIARDEAEARAHTDTMTDRSADVVAAMCTFTEAGC